MTPTSISSKRRPWDKPFDYEVRRRVLQKKDIVNHNKEEDINIHQQDETIHPSPPSHPSPCALKNEHMNTNTTTTTTTTTTNNSNKQRFKIPIPQFNVMLEEEEEEEEDFQNTSTTTPSTMMMMMIPHVMIDGIPFYSDRFYLNQPDDSILTRHDKIPIPNNNNNATNKNRMMTPPLLDRRRIIENLDIQAMIIATYTWDIQTISNLFTSSSNNNNKMKNIPCLILHGSDMPTSSSSSTTTTSTLGTTRMTTNTLIRQGKYSKKDDSVLFPKLYQQPTFSCPAYDTDDEDEDWKKEQGINTTTTTIVPKYNGPTIETLYYQHGHLYFTRILSTWIPPPPQQQQEQQPFHTTCINIPTSTNNNNNNNRQFCKGVHHPKFMLLFETDGSLTVVVTTSNLTPVTSIDASWIQRFPPTFLSSSSSSKQDKKKNPIYEEEVEKEDVWDFGLTLFDFLEKQSLAVKEGDLLPMDFIHKYLLSNNTNNNNYIDKAKRNTTTTSSSSSFSTLLHHPQQQQQQRRRLTCWKDLCTWFDFSQAQVQLVSTVPGVYSKNDCKLSSSSSSSSLSNIFIHKEVEKKKNRRRKLSTRRNQQQKRILYGPQRIAEILEHVQEKKYPKKGVHTTTTTTTTTNHSIDKYEINKESKIIKPWLPYHILSKKDRLLIQSTSWGASPWSGYHMVQLARMYLGWESSSSSSSFPDMMMTSCLTTSNKKENTNTLLTSAAFSSSSSSSSMYESHDLLEQVDILWPTQEYMNHLREQLSKSYNTTNVLEGIDDPQLGFFTTQTFNDTDLACISRMAMYQPYHKHFFPYNLPPHLKTMARILKRPSKETRRRRSSVLESSQQNDDSEVDDFAWILLTSACLSRGAQGFSKVNSQLFTSDPKTDIEKDTMSFTNFELGVLFCSRMEGNPTTDRLYQSMPNSSAEAASSSSIRNKSSPRIIPLPIPYLTRATMYQHQSKINHEDSSDAFFVARPYFHWILDGTVGVGNMKLIP